MTAAQKIAKPSPPLASYEGDYYSWLVEQAALLDAGDVKRADLLNIAEALRDLGSEQLHKLERAFRILLMHLLKWDHQPKCRSRSWHASILNNRDEISDLLLASPGLKAKQSDTIGRAYKRARREASAETAIDEGRFPSICPYSLDEIMTREIAWPPQD